MSTILFKQSGSTHLNTQQKLLEKRKTVGSFVTLATTIMMYVIFKHTFVRHGGSHSYQSIDFFMTTLFFYQLFIVSEKPLKIVRDFAIGMSAVIAMIISMNISQPGDYYGLLSSITKPRGIQNFRTYVWDYKDTLSNSQRTIEGQFNAYLQPEYVLDKVGNDTIHGYPFAFSRIFANGYNWKPFPTFETYGTYTEWLDQLNVDFFDRNEEPELILWGSSNVTVTFDSRYVLSENPLTTFKLLDNYTPVLKFKDGYILKHNKTNRFKNKRVSEKFEVAIGEPIMIPDHADNTLVRIKLYPKRTLASKIKKTLYREEPMHMFYTGVAGDIAFHRLIFSNMHTGVWAAPYLNIDERHQLGCEVLNLKPQDISLADHKLLANYKMDGFVFSGKVKSGDTIKKAQTNIILKGESSSYKVLLQSESTSLIKKDLSGCATQVPLGKYQVGIQTTEGTTKTIQMLPSNIEFTPKNFETKANKSNFLFFSKVKVTSIKIVNTTHESFEPTMEAQWEFFDYSESVPVR